FCRQVLDMAGSRWTCALGSASGRDEYKLDCYGFQVGHGARLRLPGIEEKCLAWMECRLLPVTSAAEKYDTLFGEVVSAAADERAFVAGRWQFDGDKLNTLHHLGAGTFVTSGKMVKALD
ncbi:hypothetical protein C3376_23300, partial [Enterobacter cloacae complex sp. ECNIH17]